jgi:hypothetical protein
MTSLRLKRGSTADHTNYLGPPGELTVDTDTNQLRLHNGTTYGGITVGSMTVTSVKTDSYAANAGELVRIDSTLGGFVVTLPSNPGDGSKISFIDVTNQCGTNLVLIAAANGKTVLGDSNGINLDVNGAGLSLMFNSLTNNWSKINMFSSNFSVVDSSSSILYSDDVFSAYTYTGNGSTQTINNGIDLAGKGGMVWLKSRSNAYYHHVFDSARGTDRPLIPNATDSSSTNDAYFSSFNSDGFSLKNTITLNGTDKTYVSWTFRKAAKFFDVVTYTGTGGPQTLPHNLGVQPGMVFIKRTDLASDWFVWHTKFGTSPTYGEDKILYLNKTDAVSTLATAFGSTINSSGFYAGSSISTNGATYVAYLFAHDTAADGIIQCGSYTLDGSNPTTVTLGWEPQYVLWKSASVSGQWFVADSMRGLGVEKCSILFPNLSDAESSNSILQKVTSTGFIAGSTVAGTYIYVAIRRPNKPPTVGTQVYNAILRTGTGSSVSLTTVGFAPDLVIINNTNHVYSNQNMISDRLRGATKQLQTNQTGSDAEYTRTEEIKSFDSLGVTFGTSTWATSNYSNAQYINHFFKRAPGVFDVVCYTGTGSSMTIPHSLGVAPELIITKSRSFANQNWPVYARDVGFSKTMFLDTVDSNISINWITASTASNYSIGQAGDPISRNGATYVTYLFSSKAGISKVGSYTGNGSTQTINCGFSTGARFILIKRTDSMGDWYVWDTARGIVSGNDPFSTLNDYTKDNAGSSDSVGPENSGFIVNQVSATNINVNNGTYIFLAFA